MITPNVARTLHLGANYALPAAGAASSVASYKGNGGSTGAFPVPAGITHLVFWVTYTRSAGNPGAISLRPRASNGTEDAPVGVLEDAIDVITNPPFGRQRMFSTELTPPAPSSDVAVTYPPIVVPVVPGTSMWLQVAEIGDTAHPGTCTIYVTGAALGAAS